MRQKKFEVEFITYDKTHTVIVPANSAMKAIAAAYVHFLNAGYSADDVEDIRVQKSYSYL